MAASASDPTDQVGRLVARGDAHDLGPALEPALLEMCGGRLSDVHWFTTDWQSGGAATAYAMFDPGDGADRREVVVKIPVGPREYRFLVGLSGTGAPTPAVALHGDTLGGYDFAWVVIERLSGDPLSAHLDKSVLARVAQVGATFHKVAGETWSLGEPPNQPDWDHLMGVSRQMLRDNPHVPRSQAWTTAVKHAHKALPNLLKVWASRRVNTWCHGDLHPGNCMVRVDGSPWGERADVLFDLAEVHTGHWVEDAVYLERLYWGRPDLLKGSKPVALLARARREVGLDTGDDYALLANARRVLMAACVPAFLHREGHPAYMETALGMLERLLPQFAK